MAEHVHAARVPRGLHERRAQWRQRDPPFYINGFRHDDSYKAEVFLNALEWAATEGR